MRDTRAQSYDTIVADPELGAIAQEQINLEARAEPAGAKALIRLLAEARHIMQPNYRGCWNGSEWILYTITERITTALGVAFEAGDVTLGRRRRKRGGRPESHVTLYSIRTGCHTALWAPLCDPEARGDAATRRDALRPGWC